VASAVDDADCSAKYSRRAPSPRILPDPLTTQQYVNQVTSKGDMAAGRNNDMQMYVNTNGWSPALPAFFAKPKTLQELGRRRLFPYSTASEDSTTQSATAIALYE